MVVHTRDSFISWLVMYFSNSVWSHTAIVVDNGNIVEVTLDGTIEHRFSDGLNDKDYLVIGGPPMTAEQQRSVVEGARSGVGVTKFSYRDAALIGLRNLAGVSPNYNPRLSIDLLTVLFAACWFSRRNKWIMVPGIESSILYVAIVVAGTKHRRDFRAKRSQRASSMQRWEVPE